MNGCHFAMVPLLALSLLCSRPLVAHGSVATASDADRVAADDLASDEASRMSVIDELALMESYLDGEEDLSRDEILLYILTYVKEISDSVVSGPAASPSDAEMQEDNSLEDEEEIEIYHDLVPYSLTSLDDLEGDAGIAVTALDEDSFPDSNVVLLRGTFAGTSYTVLVPMQYYSSLWVDDSGALYNLSSANITCRMFEGDEFDPLDYNYQNLTLAPVLGSTSNTVYRYDYLSYRTRYYENSSGSGLTSATTYGSFHVEEMEIRRSTEIEFKTYYVTVIILFAVGVLILCSWKNLKH